MDPQKLLQYASDVSRMSGAPVALDDGPARDAHRGPVPPAAAWPDVLLDRGMDIGMAGTTAAGRLARQWASGTPCTMGQGPFILRAFHGGLMVGCGLDNVGGHVGLLPLHGDLPTRQPAGSAMAASGWRRIPCGCRADALGSVFGKPGADPVWPRWAGTRWPSRTPSRQGHGRAPYQILYHCNFGYRSCRPSELWVDSAVRPRTRTPKGLRE